MDAALVVEPSTISALQAGDSTGVTVLTNIEWRLVYEDNWIEASANDAGNVVSIRILPNDLFETRTAVIGIVPVSDEFADLKKEITVTQAARPYKIAVSGEELDEGKIQVMAHCRVAARSFGSCQQRLERDRSAVMAYGDTV
ncbi:MAG: BACON domain-containing protein [Alistipes putredinis]|nr:MAG: BACON domain-containing protein [Alistipes putredinis]